MGTRISLSKSQGKKSSFERDGIQTQIIKGSLTLILSAIVSGTVILNSLSPFGVAAVAAVSPGMSLFALAGSVIGYALSSGITGTMKYIAAAVLVAAIKWVFGTLGSVDKKRIFAPFVAAASMLATGLAVNIGDGMYIYDVVLSFSDAALAMGAVYFFKKAIHTIINKKSLKGLSAGELCSVLVLLSVVLMSLSGLTIGMISIGRVLSVIIILLAARYGKESYGSIAGITTGIAMSLGSGSMLYIVAAYAFGGLLAGVFSPLGKVALSVAFILSNGLTFIMAGMDTLTILYETMAATLIFMLLPIRLGGDIVSGVVDSDISAAYDVKDIRRHLTMKLKYISATFEDISKSIKTVTEKLQYVSGADITDVYSNAAEDVCRKCAMKMYCWESCYGDTMNAFNDMTPELKKKGKISSENASTFLKSRCKKIDLLTASINRAYSDHLAYEGAKRKVNEVRSLLSDQYDCISGVFKELCDELSTIDKPDIKTAQKARSVFDNNKIKIKELCSYVDIYGKTSVEIDCETKELENTDLKQLTESLSSVCGIDFDKASMIRIGKDTKITMYEKASYSIDFGVAQFAHNHSAVCGDAYDYFIDNKGYAHMILSDGMGSGNRAAIDGTMATGLLTKLLKAGFSFDCAVSLVNSALMTKSDEEMLTTLDVACFDMYTGKAEFLKAGAAPTFIKKSGRAGRVETDSLPLGILKNISFEKNAISLSKGDMIVMVSDGVIAAGDEWVCAEIESYSGNDPKEFANRIARIAKQRRIDGHDDDVTVMVGMIAKGI